MKNRLIGLLLIVCCTSVSPVRALEHVVFTPQWMPQAQFAGYYVAKEMGFYKEVGLDVEIVHPSLTMSAMSRIRNNVSQIATMQLCQAMEIIDNGYSLVNILQTSMNDATMIISRNNKSPLKLKGARVAKWMDFGHMALCFNIKEGLDYQWIPLSMTISLFVKGYVDAMIAESYNEYNQLLQSGITISEESIYRLSDHGYNVQEDGVYMTREYYQNHKEQAQKFAQASKKGWEWVVKHQEEALDIVMRYVHQDHIGTNRTIQRLMLQEVLRLQVDKQSGKREFRLRPDMVKLASRLMLECKILKHEVKYEQLISE